MVLEQDDPASGIPWGRPPISSIPVPPFADQQSAAAFVADLCGYVALLGGGGPGGGPVSPTTFALLTTVQQEFDIVRWGQTWAPLPSRHVLTLAMVTYFPAPWTPHGLTDVFHDVLGQFPRRGDSSPGKLEWNSDPSFHATRSDAGEWEVMSYERGTWELVARLSTDDDMVLYRMSFVNNHPLPFGWGWRWSDMDELERAAQAAQAAWAPRAEFTYLKNWRR